MKIYDREKRKFVRIIIGECEEGMSGIKAPTKTLNVSGITVQQMWEKIFDMVNENETNRKKN